MNTQATQTKPSASAPEAMKVRPITIDRLRHAQEVCTRHRCVVEVPEQYPALLKGDLDVANIIGPRLATGDTIEVVDDQSTSSRCCTPAP